MAALQFKTGLLLVIKVFGIECDELSIAPFVFFMAVITRLILIVLAVQAMLVDYIFCDCLMAVFAQTGLRRFVKLLMAGLAVAFKFGMNLCHFSG